MLIFLFKNNNNKYIIVSVQYYTCSLSDNSGQTDKQQLCLYYIYIFVLLREYEIVNWNFDLEFPFNSDLLSFHFQIV